MGVNEPTDSEAIASWVQSAIAGIEKGLGDYELAKPIRFDLAVSTQKNKKGGIELIVATLGVSKSNEEISRISFEAESSGMNMTRSAQNALSLWKSFTEIQSIQHGDKIADLDTLRKLLEALPEELAKQINPKDDPDAKP